MKRITLLVLLFSFSIAFAVLSADLGELAKKEKARRESIDKTGKKARVFTNDDVDNLKSQLAIASKKEGEDESTEGTPTEATDTEDSSYTPPVEGAEYISPPEQQPQASDQATEQKKRIQELEQQKEELEKQANEARDTVGSGGLYHSRNTGDQYRKAREAEEKQEKLDQQIDSSRAKPTAPQTPVNEQPATPVNEQPVVEETPAEEPPPPAEEPPF